MTKGLMAALGFLLGIPHGSQLQAQQERAEGTGQRDSSPHKGVLVLTSDFDFAVRIDKGPPMSIKRGKALKVKVAAGKHVIDGVDITRNLLLHIPVEVHGGDRQVVKLGDDLVSKLAAGLQSMEKAEAETQSKGYWADPGTRLMWAGRDGDSDMNWNQATEYCENARFGQSRDWRLPEIEELKQIYSFGIGRTGILLSSKWSWSATKAGSEEAWGLSFNNGEQYSVRLDDRITGLRALCVRRP